MPYILILITLFQVALWSEDGVSKYKDQPTHVQTTDEQRKIEEAIAPYIAKAKATFPAVKERYKVGLPKGSTLYVTYKIVDGSKFEVSFMKVLSITDKTITAKIANELTTVKSVKRGQDMTFSEDAIVDWTIVDSAGEEEGNVVGKFLDTYKP